MKDRFNKQLNAGDTVIIIFATKNGYNIDKGIIRNFTAKKVRVDVQGTYYNEKGYLRMPQDLVLYN